MTVSSATKPSSTTPTGPVSKKNAKAAYLTKKEDVKTQQEASRVLESSPPRPTTPTLPLPSAHVKADPALPSKKTVNDLFYNIFAPMLTDKSTLDKLEKSTPEERMKWLVEQSRNAVPEVKTFENEELVQKLKTLSEELEKTKEELIQMNRKTEEFAQPQTAIAENVEGTQTKENEELKQQLKALNEELENSRVELLKAKQSILDLHLSKAHTEKDLEDLHSNLRDIKVKIITHAAELQKILPKDPTQISQITPGYLKTTIDNCINQVNDLKKFLGLETENEVEVTASSSYETPKPEKSILAQLEAYQTDVLKLNGELEVSFPKEETQEEASLASSSLAGFLNQLKTNAELMQKLKPEIVKTIQALQGEIAKQQIPLFEPEVLRAIEIVTGWYKKEHQVNDISRHLKSQKEKTDDLKEILRRWTVIHETLENISSRLENLLLYMSYTEDSCLETWMHTRNCITDLNLERDLVTEPSMKNMISMNQFTNLWKRLKNFSVFLRASRKIESDNNKPNSRLGDKYKTQKAQLIELNTQYNYIMPIITSIVEQLQKQVDVGASGESISPEALKRFAIILNRTVDDIKDNNIKPFERDHDNRAALLSSLKTKIGQINESADLAKKEVNRTFDATQCGNVYRYETVYNLRGFSDPEVNATFKDGASSGVICDSPLITRHTSDKQPAISSR